MTDATETNDDQIPQPWGTEDTLAFFRAGNTLRVSCGANGKELLVTAFAPDDRGWTTRVIPLNVLQRLTHPHPVGFFMDIVMSELDAAMLEGQ